MAAIAGVDPKTLRLKAIDSTNAPPHPTIVTVVREHNLTCARIKRQTIPTMLKPKIECETGYSTINIILHIFKYNAA